MIGWRTTSRSVTMVRAHAATIVAVMAKNTTLHGAFI
jgi:hypothetical protein